MADLSDDEQIVPVPPPWKLKATVYMLSFWSSKGSVTRGKDSGKGEREHGPSTIAYSPLEAKSPFADPAASGEHLGGLSQIQILRYTESPVGTYDELIICPGSFAYEKDDGKGKGKRMKSLRITRIYVSRKKTCWNGRSSEFALMSSFFFVTCVDIRQIGISQNTLRASNGMNHRMER